MKRALLAWMVVTMIGKAGASTPEQEIRALETQWNEARAHADVATLDRILVDDWTVTHANGTTDTKTKYLADLRSGARKFSGAVTVSDFVVRVYGDTAVASGSSDSTVTLNGQPQGGTLHFTRVYVKRNGAWKMIVTQATQR
jgi:ketosteroid isomerase-like protein